MSNDLYPWNNYFLECINDYKKICKNGYLLSIGITPLYLGSSLEENNNQIKNGNKLSNGISYFASHNIFKNNKEEKMASIKEYLWIIFIYHDNILIWIEIKLE